MKYKWHAEFKINLENSNKFDTSTLFKKPYIRWEYVGYFEI
jgi:hypothetical protein